MRKINLAIFMALLLSGCSFMHKETVDPTNLGQLQGMSEQTTELSSESAISQIRTKALEDTALSLGAQGGLAWASEKINYRLKLDKKSMENLYNFNGMMLSHGVIPPVLEEGNFTLNLADPNTIRVSDKTYKIVEQARFATTPPNWRDYLWMSYTKPDLPHKFLLPRNAEEKQIWIKAINKGWDKGIMQASSIFQQNLARLKRDYKGMILYRKLLQEKMISAPFVSRTELGITGDGNDMRINDQVLRITELPQLQTNSHDWNAIVVNKNVN
jgi:defect in organelle trafficking protein DotC